MNLSNYFLADLPAEATLNASMISEACDTLKRNRARYLEGRTTEQIVRLLSPVAKEWLEPDNAFRQHVLNAGPSKTGFSTAVLEAGLDSFFSQITEKNLQALIVQDLGHQERLDRFVADDLETARGCSSFARGPELLVHVAAGNLPNSTLMSMVIGLLLRSAQFVKCASGTSFIPRMFAYSLYEAEPKLGACLEIAEWKGGTHSLEEALFAQADCVTASGTDETLASIRKTLPHKVRFLGYGHRVSFGYIAQEMLSASGLQKLIAAAANDVTAWDQQGCLSPHVLYVESGGSITPELFAEKLAVELDKWEKAFPRGELKAEESGAISYRRSIYEVRAAGSEETRLWQSKDSTAWTVVHENDPRFQLSCLNRFIYVKAVANLQEALQGADAVMGKVSTVGLAAPAKRASELAQQLARWGVTRICPLGEMQNPPLTWRHDGRPALGDFVTWSDWEI